MVVKESAILFESGIYKSCDFIILVCASMEERVLRVMKRDGMSRAAVLERMSNQWDDSKKRILADFVIENNDLEFAEQQLEYLFEKVLYETKD
jgi:dephospho-CoA kinase